MKEFKVVEGTGKERYLLERTGQSCEYFGGCGLFTKSCLALAAPWTVALQAPLVHGIFQARILEWVAISFPGDLTDPGIEPRDSCTASRFFTN